jgi:hypothetical protein
MRTLTPQWRAVLMGSWVMILVLSVATLTLYVDNTRTRACISNYMVADQRGSSARVELTDRERDVFKGTLRVIIDPKATPVERGNAINAYIDLLDRDDQIRAQNPVKPVPTECD